MKRGSVEQSGLQFLTAAFLACIAPFVATPAQADEPIFGFTYTTDLLPQDQTEVAQWATWRSGKSRGSFNVVENRTEVEYGLTNNFQISAYLNYYWAEAFHDDVNGDTFPAETFAEWQVGPNDRMNAWKLTSVSVEGIWRVLSPYTDPVGLAFLIEPEVGDGLYELETRMILQKNFLDDRLVVALNVTAKPEWRKLPGDTSLLPSDPEASSHFDKEMDVNIGLGLSYRFVENWSAGLEFQNEREWAGLNPLAGHNRTNDVYYLGPTLHYAGEHSFATLTVLDQMPWASDDANPAPGFIVGGRNYADDFERFRVRLKFGWYF